MAWAQRTLTTLTPSTTSRSTLTTAWYLPYFNSASGGNLTTIGEGEDLWLRDESQITNKFVTSGDSAFMRGGSEDDLVIYINAQMTGRIFSVGNGGDDWYDDGENFANNNTWIIGQDDPLLSSVTGKSVDRSNVRQRVDDNAVSIFIRASTSDTDPEKNMGSYTFEEGNYYGGSGRFAGVIQYANNVEIKGASFKGGAFDSEALDEGTIVSGTAPVGLWVGNLKGALMISNDTDNVNDNFEAGDFTSDGTATGGGTYSQGSPLNGGAGLYATTIAGGTTIHGGTFIGSQEIGNNLRTLEYTDFDTIDAYVSAFGGAGAQLESAGTVTIHDGDFIGGDAGIVTVGGPNATAASVGGAGLYIHSSGTTKISGGTYEAGRSGSATIVAGGYYLFDEDGTVTEASPSDENGQATAYGASGILLNGNGATTISNVTATASSGASARSSSDAQAYGGSGITAIDTALTIESGTFTGADGGNATGEGNVIAIGGSGVYSSGGDLTIKGGEFYAGAGGTINGTADDGNIGIMVLDGSLNISEAVTDTLIEGDIAFGNTAAETLAITGGTITGDILKWGAGKATVRVSTNANYSGSFVQTEGAVSVELSNSEEAKFFSDVAIVNSAMSFDKATGFQGEEKVVTKEGSSFVLYGTNSTLTFNQLSLELSENSEIDAGYGQITTVGGNLEMMDNSTISFSTNFLTKNAGSLTVGGDLILTNRGSKIVAGGIADTTEGSYQVASSANVILASESFTNTLRDVVKADFGWLTQLDSADTNGGITVNWKYKSISDSEKLMDLDPRLLSLIDNSITNSTSEKFYDLNSLGEASGTENINYAAGQLPDIADSAFQVQQGIADQLASRSTDFRIMNGFASSRKPFTPSGVAGPDAASKQDGAPEKDLQGWIRGYGSLGDRDKDGAFSDYDSDTWGTIVGLDKSFGNLLVGVAGGYARTHIDASQTYKTDTDTKHGSVYSSIGFERLYFDASANYAWLDTDEENSTTRGSIDATSMSGYIGGGMVFKFKDRFAITPAASFLASHYDQDSYTRKNDLLGQMKVDSYDEDSYLSSLGVNIASVHHIDIFSKGFAFSPELRMHWLHEFNDDLDDGSFTLQGQDFPLFVRSRDENSFRFGLGLDLWHWRYQNTKFEFDYDGMFSDNYTQHMFSGKIGIQF